MIGEIEQGGRSGLSRRQMIKASAVAGAAAWTAPTIIDSLSSPAAAGSLPAPPVGHGCWKFRSLHDNCAMSAATCPKSPATPTACSTSYVFAGAANNLSQYCITTNPANCSFSGSLTYTIGANCSCTFVDAYVEADNGACAKATISGDKKSVTIVNTNDQAAVSFYLSC
jgi:hypothetical protein